MANIILGVSGSISAYRSADIARELMRMGNTVRVCLTRSGAKFVQPALFEALTGQPCLVDAFEEPETGKMAHIEWARWADLILIAPATAHVLSSLANGYAEDMLTTVVLATTAPLVVAPAMNPMMWENPATQKSAAILRAKGVFVEPCSGEVACGEVGKGRLAPVEDIARAAQTVIQTAKILAGKNVLITSGPTQERWDSVRYLTNRSSGKMGSALAQAALLMGAEVTVVAGPQTHPLPVGARVVRVRSAAEMLEAALDGAPQANLIMGAAAVADYRPAEPVRGKIRRSGEEVFLRLVPNPDIIAKLAEAAPKARVIAFAAEPDDDLANAEEKARRKGVWGIAVNDVSRADVGFESDENELTLVRPGSDPNSSPLMSKFECALWLLKIAAEGL